MNYRYRTKWGEEIIISQEEEDKVTEQLRTGQHAMLIFRNGTLKIDTGTIGFGKRTYRLTEDQEILRQNTKALPQRTTQASDESLVTHHNKVFEQMGWKHGPGCTRVCKYSKRDKKGKFIK